MITCVQFLEGPPPKIWEGQNVQISERLRTTFDFDREYLRNVWACQKSEKYFINYYPSQVGEDIPTGMEVIEAQTLNVKRNFKFSRLIFFFGGGDHVPVGVCARLPWSISSEYKNFMAQHPLRAEI